MRETFEKLFWDNKSVRRGELLKFTGTIGGRNKNTNALITDIRLIDERYPTYVFEDHVWLPTYYYWRDTREEFLKARKELLKCKINKGKKVIFTAKVVPYHGKANYGLRLDENSILTILD